MRNFAIVGLILCASCSTLENFEGAPGETREQLALFVGQRSVDTGFEDAIEDVFDADLTDDASEGIDDLESQTAFGLEYSRARTGQFGWEAGLGFGTSSEDVGGLDFELNTVEIYTGVRKDFSTPESKLIPYLGLGVAFVTAELEIEGFDADENSLGAYAHGGAAYQISKNASIGLDVRILTGTDLDDDLTADYLQIALMLGWSL
jgi:opacity protein-like surface antigen